MQTVCIKYSGYWWNKWELIKHDTVDISLYVGTLFLMVFNSYVIFE